MYPLEKMLINYPGLKKPEMPDLVRSAITLEEKVRLKERKENNSG